MRNGYGVISVFVFLLFFSLAGSPGAEAADFFDVRFESNGGSSVSPYLNVPAHSRIELPPEPTRKGYDFEGWYKDSGFRTRWDFGYNVVTENLVLYARWAALYRVTVVNGYADRDYARYDERVEITARRSDWYRDFDKWTSDTPGVYFADKYRSRTTFRMPDRDVTVRARYGYDDNYWSGCNGGFIGTAGLSAAVLLTLLRAESQKRRRGGRK